MKQSIRGSDVFVKEDIRSVLQALLATNETLAQMAGADVHWVKEASLHVTVRFLGDLAPEEILPVAAAIRRATADAERDWYNVGGATFDDVPAGWDQADWSNQ